MGIFDRFKKTAPPANMPDFEFRTVEQLKDSYEFGIMGFLGFSTDWTEHCRELGVHEYPTLDFVRALAKYTSKRKDEILSDQQRPLRVLEIAAGTGYIALGVRQQLDKLHDGKGADVVEWRATDANTYNYDEEILEANGVVIADFRDELEVYDPDIIFGAFIPESEDEKGHKWVKKFAEAGVPEYLLTGYNIALTSTEDSELYMAYCADGYSQITPAGFEGTQLSNRADKMGNPSEMIPNTKILSFRPA